MTDRDNTGEGESDDGGELHVCGWRGVKGLFSEWRNDGQVCNEGGMFLLRGVSREK